MRRPGGVYRGRRRAGRQQVHPLRATHGVDLETALA